jgi:hypothetical protein
MASTEPEEKPMSASIVHDRRRLLVGLALLLGLAEFGDAFIISFWEGAAVASALWLASARWTRRAGLGGPILAGSLSVFELQSFPTWQRNGIEDWILQVPVAVLSAVTLVVALAVLKQGFAARKAAALREASA